MTKKSLFLFVFLAIGISITLSACDKCEDKQTVPVELLKFKGKIFLNEFSWSDTTVKAEFAITNITPPDSPTDGHYIYKFIYTKYGRDGADGVYSFSLVDTISQVYLDLETGKLWERHIRDETNPGVFAEVLSPEEGGDLTKYLEEFNNRYPDPDSYGVPGPYCADCANSAYFARYLTHLLERYEFNDDHLIPSNRLYFGGTLHYSTIIYGENGCGWSPCRFFILRRGAGLNMEDLVPESAGHYGITASGWHPINELDLETGILVRDSKIFNPTDAKYLNEIKGMKEYVGRMLDTGIDDGSTWMYANPPVIVEAYNYLQYIIDRKAAKGM